MRNSLVSQKLPKVPTNKTNFKNYSLMEVFFQNAPNFAVTKGDWSRMPVPSTKLLAYLLPVFRHVDVYCIEIVCFLQPLLTICFVLSFRIPNSCRPITRCQKWMLPCLNTLYNVYLTRTLTLDCCRQSQTLMPSQNCVKCICDAAQVWGGPRAMEHTKECLLLRRPGC